MQRSTRAMVVKMAKEGFVEGILEMQEGLTRAF